MSYNSQENMFHYYNDRPFTFSNSFSKSSALPTPSEHHQEQHIKMSPGNYFVTPVPSPSLMMYSSSIASLSESTSSFSETLSIQESDDDDQPLDLSIHPMRDKKSLKRAHVDEHGPVCMIKACTCSISNTKSQHMSLYPTAGQAVVRSPKPGMTLSSMNIQDSFYSSQDRTYGSSFRNNATSPSGYLPQNSTLTTTASSSFQLVTSSDNVLNGNQNSSSIFRSYDDHINQDTNSSQWEQQEEPLLFHPKNHTINVHDDDDNRDGYTYMVLDSASTAHLSSKHMKSYIENSHYMCSKLTMLHDKSNDKTETLNSPHESPVPQVLKSRIGFNSCEIPAACYVGSVISHTSLEKNTRISSSFPMSVSSSSDHLKHEPEPQMYAPHCRSPLSSAALPTDNSTCCSAQQNTPQITAFQSQQNHSHTSISHAATAERIYSMADVSEQQPACTNNFDSDQPGSKSPLNKGNASRNKSNNVRSTSNTARYCFYPPVTTSKNTNTIQRNKQKIGGESRDINLVHQQTSESKDNENATKISLLDFWISKILMERSSEIPRPSKPCNVDYICTANGEKRIRLRLVDLMELQVEQSLKA